MFLAFFYAGRVRMGAGSHPSWQTGLPTWRKMSPGPCSCTILSVAILQGKKKKMNEKEKYCSSSSFWCATQRQCERSCRLPLGFLLAFLLGKRYLAFWGGGLRSGALLFLSRMLFLVAVLRSESLTFSSYLIAWSTTRCSSGLCESSRRLGWSRRKSLHLTPRSRPCSHRFYF